MFSRILTIDNQKSFFLLGPRATGKTTWVRDRFPGAKILDLLEPDLYYRLLAKPASLREYIGSDFSDWVVIDEIQRVPELLNVVHQLIESHKISQAAVLNITDVARDCEVDRKSVEGYFSILEDLLIARRVPVFQKRAKRKTVAHPKFYFFDAGVYRALRPCGPLDAADVIPGAAMESLVFQELVAINQYYEFGYEIFFWRTTAGLEVDFILSGKGGLLAFEVKCSAKVDHLDLRGLREFRSDYPMARCFVFYGGEEYLEIDGIKILPLKFALPQLDRYLTPVGSVES